MKGLAAQGLLALKNGNHPVVISFFEEAHSTIISFLEDSSVPFFEIPPASDTVGHSLCVVRASAIHEIKTHKERQAVFLFFGHYPLMEVEQQILDTLRTRAPQATAVFCLSLEDPLFRVFGGAGMIRVVEMLGLADDDCIEHTMVTKSIQRAREKLSEKVGGNEIKATSETDWFSKNLPA
jgi:hypothetical protein